ncbi:Ldh family oxidoreductase [Telmatospirillum sp. J64-1]|uniref:Ldh family oxidoreductase n=1 Tax=Telmatospirillum sp. J64-1 TaxID=2502183 RepID=UPI00115D8F36|nr:Ldh family oxidoreductase [Telmatospirillum sp. J64-1]
MSSVTLPPAEWQSLAERVLVAAGTAPKAARSVAAALVAADRDGLASHGLSRLPAYAAQVRCGKVAGTAQPGVRRPAPGIIAVDAADGFAYPAIEAGLQAAQEAVHSQGCVLVAVTNSHHCGVLGHHVEWLAERGLVALAFANTPAAIAPWGGSKPVLGTDPLAFACPRDGHPPLVIDMSVSVAARGKIMVAARDGTPIPPDWALDSEGRPTTDAKAAMEGTLAPMAGAKGAALGLMIELLTAALVDAHFGFEASPFLDDKGGPPRTGQLFLVIDPQSVGGSGFAARAERLFTACLEQPGVRLPGDRRQEIRAATAEGITVPRKLHDELVAAADQLHAS